MSKNHDILDESNNVKAALRYAAGEVCETPGYCAAGDRLEAMGLISTDGGLTDIGWEAYDRLVAFERLDQ